MPSVMSKQSNMFNKIHTVQLVNQFQSKRVSLIVHVQVKITKNNNSVIIAVDN